MLSTNFLWLVKSRSDRLLSGYGGILIMPIGSEYFDIRPGDFVQELHLLIPGYLLYTVYFYRNFVFVRCLLYTGDFPRNLLYFNVLHYCVATVRRRSPPFNTATVQHGHVTANGPHTTMERPNTATARTNESGDRFRLVSVFCT